MSKLGDLTTLTDLMECTRDDTFSLPTVQRGFVWKPHQIENFWDSLLRGYPVGSFVLSQLKDSPGKYELLDGQQRASAICLGFYNPLKSRTDNAFFKTSSEQIMIFIDLAKPNFRSDNRKYLFRVITRSHPWGYQRRENQKTLESKHIKKALDAYGTEGYRYLKNPLKDFWPFDAYEPVPLGLFLNGSDAHAVEESVNAWKAGKSLDVIRKTGGMATDFYSIAEVFRDVQQMLDHQKIPLTYLDLAKLYVDENSPTDSLDEAESIVLEDDYRSPDPEQENAEDRTIDEIENLFIRLNSGGTPLSGEELNYSVLKAHISREMQVQIEKKCQGLFKAPRFITIAFRLYSISEKGTTASESLRMRVKPKQFQRTMKSSKEDFIKFLAEHFLDGDLIEQVRNLLSFSRESNPIGLPSFICASLSEKAPEIMFMLLYRLIVKKDKIDESIKPLILGMLTLFVWLGKGENQRDHSRLLRIIWPCATHFDAKRFWSSETIQRAMINDDYELLTPFPKIEDLKNRFLKNRLPTGRSLKIPAFTFNKIYKEAYDPDKKVFYGDFIDKMFFNKELILYAQRAHLSEWFNQIESYHLEDTNRAFDWDHICPHSYIFNKKKIHRALRDWYGSNGNFRAWPYAWNRAEGDLAPPKKLHPKENDEINWWADTLNRPRLSSDELKTYLLEASVCDTQWVDLKVDTGDEIKQTPCAKEVIRCILNRNLKICKEWYEQLQIETLLPEIPENRENLFYPLLNMKVWGDAEEEDDWPAYQLSIRETNIQLYFSFNIGGHTIAENGIYLAFLSDDETAFENMEIPEKLSQKYSYVSGDQIGSDFTLRSYAEDSLIELFQELHAWIKKFPDINIRVKAIDAFQKGIKVKYRDRIFLKEIT